jgi:hypothetical protein
MSSICHCSRCGSSWRARVEAPVQCPRCKRVDWLGYVVGAESLGRGLAGNETPSPELAVRAARGSESRPQPSERPPHAAGCTCLMCKNKSKYPGLKAGACKISH